ncbi:hypothetical protein FB567DRAFT_612807 [Paraphoma chrysanthemicola]|uniref:Uncharacterized protein n=1 Tax=Paraphoma chrysanthemicola TaxID=798071 RepID=A0A8K0QTU1_9PLEO|nr:hypothetical protein FB567DRAFT_612807 [Paraphoma chrysanthemicola]
MPPSPPTPCPVREPAPEPFHGISSRITNDSPAVSEGDQARLDMHPHNPPSSFNPRPPIHRGTLHQGLCSVFQEARDHPSRERPSSNVVRLQAVRALIVANLILLLVVIAMPLFIVSELQCQSFVVACVVVLLSFWRLDRGKEEKYAGCVVCMGTAIVASSDGFTLASWPAMIRALGM